jgi:hypothetical protein
MTTTSAESSHQNSRSKRPSVDAALARKATPIASETSVVIPGARPRITDRAGEKHRAPVEEDGGAEHGRDPAVARELRRGEAEPVLDRFAVDDDRDGEDQVDPEPTPVDLGVVGMRLPVVSVAVLGVVGVGVHR